MSGLGELGGFLFGALVLEDSLQGAPDQARQAIDCGRTNQQMADWPSQSGDRGAEFEDDRVCVCDYDLRGHEGSVHSPSAVLSR
jgi:hypothetical protein